MAYKYSYDYEEKAYTPQKLPENRSMWKLLLLTPLTLGLYAIFFFIPFSFDLDKAAPTPDRSRTPNYLWAYLLSLFTFAIVLDLWYYHVTARMESALEEQNIDYTFSRRDFWLWYILGSLILLGPLVYFYKLCKAMNLLCARYNAANATKK